MVASRSSCLEALGRNGLEARCRGQQIPLPLACGLRRSSVAPVGPLSAAEAACTHSPAPASGSELATASSALAWAGHPDLLSSRLGFV